MTKFLGRVDTAQLVKDWLDRLFFYVVCQKVFSADI